MLSGKIITATPLSVDAAEQIKNYFQKKYIDTIDFTMELDESILGGFIVKIGNEVFDKSIRAHLNHIKSFIYQHTYAHDEPFDAKFHLEDISEFARNRIENVGAFDNTNAGVVTSSADGVVTVEGLRDVEYGELLLFENDCKGLAMNVGIREVGAVLLNGAARVSEGSYATSTGKVISIPVGDEMLGRVVNPLGEPLDGRGSVAAKKTRPIEAPAPRIMQRSSVKQPLKTGIMAIDSMIPIGMGQRELIIGDRQTGKTAIAIDTIINQRNRNVMCIYVAIGQKASTIAGIVDTLKKTGAIDYTVVVAAVASDDAAMLYIAPYAGCAIAEEFMYSGKNVLIIYDDLSKHAVAYRTMSLLLRRPPGREAYPGDVFYLHSRLLERSAALSSELGGGTMTALPIIETMAGNISAYIPTNVISITDGQIFLETELFKSGTRPAINVGYSVSRVGGAAQTKAMRRVAGRLRIDLAQYRELAVFAQFAGDLDKNTLSTLNHGIRLTEVLKQDQYKTLKQSQQVIKLYASVNRHLEDIPVHLVRQFLDELVYYVEANYKDAAAEIDRGLLSDTSSRKLEDAIGKFKPVFIKKHSIAIEEE